MKVLDLRCAHDHRFEGWFASEDDFASQVAEQRIDCPLCADTHIERMPSAPRLNISHRADSAPAAPSDASARMDVTTADTAAQLQALWLNTMRRLVASTEDVGQRFAEEARRMHYGEIEDRAIRGQTTPQEAQALHEEGIEVVALPIPPGLKGGLLQ